MISKQNVTKSLRYITWERTLFLRWPLSKNKSPSTTINIEILRYKTSSTMQNKIYANIFLSYSSFARYKFTYLTIDVNRIIVTIENNINLYSTFLVKIKTSKTLIRNIQSIVPKAFIISILRALLHQIIFNV